VTDPNRAAVRIVTDPDFTLYVGDVTDVLEQLPDESVHCVVTSPPYWGLRDYGTGLWDGGDPDCDHAAGNDHRNIGFNERYGRATVELQQEKAREFQFRDICGKCGATRQDRQLGLEPTPDLYVANMVAVFRQVRRVLRRDGTCWLNIGDSYNNRAKTRETSHQPALNNFTDDNWAERAARGGVRMSINDGQIKEKDLCGIPWRLAFALQADGWYLRSEIIWAKPNPMPESVTDRPTKSHEQVFLLTRSPRYFYDADAVREPLHPDTAMRAARHPNGEPRPRNVADTRNDADSIKQFAPSNGRNLRSVWEIATQPYPEAHFATYPEALVERCVKAGTSEHGCCPECGAPWERIKKRADEPLTKKLPGRCLKVSATLGWRPTCGHAHPPVPPVVLDPFMGSGTTALVCRRLGRRSIGVELNQQYAELAARRLSQLSLLAVNA
jgi:DNA modification methylase